MNEDSNQSNCDSNKSNSKRKRSRKQVVTSKKTSLIEVSGKRVKTGEDSEVPAPVSLGFGGLQQGETDVVVPESILSPKVVERPTPQLEEVKGGELSDKPGLTEAQLTNTITQMEKTMHERELSSIAKYHKMTATLEKSIKEIDHDLQLTQKKASHLT